jgi:uncharacterized integral membrane protein
MTEPNPIDAGRGNGEPPVVNSGRRDRARVVAAAIVGALVAVFAVLNLNDVKVHWLVATSQTPLILVVLLPFVLGIVVDRLLVIRARRRDRAASNS